MRGTIIEHVCNNGKKSWGYSFFAGRNESGKRIQRVKRGYAKKGEAEEALRTAIDELGQAPPVEQTIPTFAEFFERWDKECFSRECSRKTAERYRELGRYTRSSFSALCLSTSSIRCNWLAVSISFRIKAAASPKPIRKDGRSLQKPFATSPFWFRIAWSRRSIGI
jgi:hypothetical protein